MNNRRIEVVGIAAIGLVMSALVCPGQAVAVRSGSGQVEAGLPWGNGQVAGDVARRRPALPSDFDGDGYGDLAIGVPGETSAGVYGSGAVNVLYGSSRGITAADDQLWSQASPGVVGDPESDGSFGSALASGDFDGDGYADLAVVGSGRLTILRGSPTGLAGAGSQVWTAAQLTPAGLDGVTWLFGGGGGSALCCPDRPLAVADFDHDGFADLAAVFVGWDGIAYRAGRGVVMYGGPDGLSPAGVTILDRATLGLASDVTNPEANLWTSFVQDMATGDLDADGFADLALGVPGQQVRGIDEAGVVAVLYGGAGGLSPVRRQIWSQDSPGIRDRVEGKLRWNGVLGEGFGASVAIGDFGQGGAADLAVGIPKELQRDKAVGAAAVIYGSASGLRAEGNQLWHLDRPGVPGAAQRLDMLGMALAAGDLSGGSRDELVIAAQYHEIQAHSGSGALLILQGGRHGLTATRARLFTPATPGVPGRPNRIKELGKHVAVAQYGRSHYADVVASFIGGGPAHRQGKVLALYGARSGLSATGAAVWSQESPGVLGTSSLGYVERFGTALTP